MIRDKASYFSIDMRDTNSVPTQFLDAIENDLGSILAQTPTEDKLALYLKYNTKGIDRNNLTATPKPNVNIEALFDDFHATLVTIDKRLSELEK
tara:strand:- start:120 stop:401 length:282 start_codon:yes stop_codon:yes gene_type:complete